MKRLPLTIGLLLMASCLFITQDILSHALAKNVRPALISPVSHTMTPSILYHPFIDFLPLYSFDHEVCRRPLLSVPLSDISYPNTVKPYSFIGMTFKTQPLGTHFIQAKSQLTYKKGNTYLLIPRSFIMPVNPGLTPQHPSITLPGSD